jgi:cyclopropane fatty-acyl-phospholipid synthase-like methyltransferase
MLVTKIAREAGSLAIYHATSGGTQNFLGSRWIEYLVDNAPTKVRGRIALRFLSLSPHYFYDRDIHSESDRNRQSRQALADVLIAPHLNKAARVLDYGCGPGYMACAVAERVDHVYAVAISRGVLACARVLNGRPNITFLRPSEIRQGAETVDLAYSFAVVQHMRTEIVSEMLGLIARRLRQDGILLLHFALTGQGGWRTEAEWLADKSMRGRAKLRYGLNCFGRSVDEMVSLVSRCGFTDVVVRSLSGSINVPVDDDIVHQHWLTARRS